MESLTEINTKSAAKDKLNSWVAISVALLATFMAITKVKDDNIVQAMLQAKSDAVDTWGEYQAKRIKHHLVELGRTQALAFQATAPGAAPFEKQAQDDEAEIKRYQSDEADLQKKAKGYEARYDALNFRDDQFDLSDAALSVALAMLAITALTGKRWLLWLSWLFAVFGVVMGVAGLIGLGLHPNWLSNLLS